MKLTIWILALLWCGSAGAGMDFAVDAQGGLHVMQDGKTVLREEAPALVAADWRRVAEFAAVPAGCRTGNGAVVTTWSDGDSTMTRSVEALPDGRLRIVWSMRFRNGVSAARHVELDLLLSGGPRVRPVGEPSRRLIVPVGEKTVEITFAGFSIPWVFEQRQKSESRLILAWNYDPAAINRIESTMLIEVIQRKATEEK